MTFFIFQMAMCHHIEVLKHKILFADGCRGPSLRHITMPNVVEIDPSVAEIL